MIWADPNPKASGPDPKAPCGYYSYTLRPNVGTTYRLRALGECFLEGRGFSHAAFATG